MDITKSLAIYSLAVIITIIGLSILQRMGQLRLFENPFYFKEKNLYIRKGIILGFISFIPMWCLLAFRGMSVGNDTHGTYYRIFKLALKHYKYKTSITEVGYYWLNEIIAKFFTSYHIFLIVIATISWGLFYLYICRESENPWLSIVIFFLSFFYFRQYNAIRQMLAEAIALSGFRYIYNRKIINYTIVIIIAATIHNTAIILLPLYFLYDIKLDSKRTLLLIIASKIFSSVAIEVVLPIVLSGTKYYRMIYDIQAYKGGYWISDIIVSTTVLFFSILLIDSNDDKIFRFNTWMIMMSTILAINSNTIPMVGRLLWYTNINVYIFIPMILNRINKDLNRALASFALVGVYFAYFIQQWSLGIESVQKYVFWIE